MSRNILIIDNDVLVNLYSLNDNSSLKHVISILNARYSKLWIPQEVINEFCDKHPKLKNKRTRFFENLLDSYQFIERCPIPVSKNDINLENNFSDSDMGEIDAILQASKAKASQIPHLSFEDIHLFFNDNGAIRKAKNRGITILYYKQFAEEMRETGVILP